MMPLDRYHESAGSPFNNPGEVAFYNIQPENKETWELQTDLPAASRTKYEIQN